MKNEEKELIELFASIKQHQKNIERQEKILNTIEKSIKRKKRNKIIMFFSAASSIAACLCIVWWTYSPVENSEIIIESIPIAKTIIEPKKEVETPKVEKLVKPKTIAKKKQEEIIVKKDSVFVEIEEKQLPQIEIAEVETIEEKPIGTVNVRIETNQLISYKENPKDRIDFSWKKRNDFKEELFVVNIPLSKIKEDRN